MVTMSLLPPRQALTRADLDAMPDDGLRYELLDGSLIVTPAPSVAHQATVTELMRVLLPACPDHLYLLTAPTDVVLAEDTVLQPDLMVVERTCLQSLTAALRPLLVIEVLSPSTGRIDLTLKKSRYEAAGTPAYWVVDIAGPSITAWELVDGRYAEPTVVVGEEILQVAAPFDVALSAGSLTV